MATCQFGLQNFTPFLDLPESYISIGIRFEAKFGFNFSHACLHTLYCKNVDQIYF